MARLYTKKWPGAAVLMEIAHDLIAYDVAIDIDFTPRDDNMWSDALANGCSAGFDPALRYNPDISQPEYWHALPKLLRLPII